ncbi:hypothetical protein [uncultured Megasphaera sp.]|uniref:hypothetical protein n=1 Tax=uncultured Megasphaera sp. TaxID=165188 RepID=UPI00266B6C27|nr:hypothetical protein [uncultured Megasphaera sp.]
MDRFENLEKEKAELLKRMEEYDSLSPEDKELICKWKFSAELSPKEQEAIEKLMYRLYRKSFLEQYGCLQYVVLLIYLGLLIDAGYQACIGGDWITPMICVAGLFGLGIVAYIVAEFR